MPRGRLIVAYLVLVGVPLLALLGILRSGERLVPPASVRGSWNVEADFGALANPACRGLLSSVKQPFLSISQSGPSLALTLNNPQRTTLTGTIRNGSVSTGPGTVSAADRCVDPRTLRVVAEVAKQAGQRVLTGTLSLMDCVECAPIPFRATQQPSKESEGQ